MKTIKNFGKSLFILAAFFMLSIFQVSAHCDSYDGPVIQDALKALEQNKVELVLKWVEPKHEKEIIAKFQQTIRLKGKNAEINKILENSFLETLVRLHREGEGASYTGIKPAGSMTPLVEMADNSLVEKNIDHVVTSVNNHLTHVLKEKYEKVVELSKTKDESVEKGREYVMAYVDYTHTLEALEHILSGDAHHHAH